MIDPTAGNGHARHLSGEAVTLLPTPAVNDMGAGKEPADWDAWTAAQQAKHGNGNGHGKSLHVEAARAPSDPDWWGVYAPAVARWEDATRPAPPATEPTGPASAHRLSPAFVEWMMGLPAGHVTDPTLGLGRNEQLKALGNGVVPQQAQAATHAFLTAHPTLLTTTHPTEEPTPHA